MIKLNLYCSDGNYIGVEYEGTLKKFIKLVEKGKCIKIKSKNKTWYLNSGFMLAFEEIKNKI